MAYENLCKVKEYRLSSAARGGYSTASTGRATAARRSFHARAPTSNIRRLLAEQRKTQKRVNAFKYKVIPRCRNTIRYIQFVPEEKERNTLFQIKILRESAN